MTLHNALSVATPSQRLAAAAHNARHQRFSQAAYAKKLEASARADEVQAKRLEAEWQERQKSIPVQKQWFSLIATIGKVETGKITVTGIIKAACRHFDYSHDDLLTPGRFKQVVYARHVVMYLARTLTDKSLPEIGRRLGGLDHTTVLHGFHKIERAIKSDATIAYDVAHVEAML